MKIGLPKDGSFQTVDGVKFTIRTSPAGGRFYDAGALAHRIRVDPIPSGEVWRYHGVDFGTRDFVQAARSAIRGKRARIDQARKMVAEYDAALQATVANRKSVRWTVGGLAVDGEIY